MDYHTLEKMTVTNLREEAKQYPEIKATSGMKKEELVKLLAERMGIEIPHKTHKKSKHEYTLDKTGLKKKIEALKEQRVAARAKNDRKQVGILRRRIHILKREIKKIAGV